MHKLSVVVAMLVGAGGCAVVGGGENGSSVQDVNGTTYVNIVDFNSSAYQDVWFDIGGTLAANFNSVCSTSYCKGTYANLTPLTFACTVSSKEGSVKDCAWTFAGSVEAVNDKTAAIGVDAPTFQCHVAPKTTAGKLVTALSVADALHAPLPGLTGPTGSIADSLAACFAAPIGSTPVTPTTDASPTYVEASAYYTTTANIAKWTAAKTALVNGFNNICGDTFCGSDYDDLQSLAITCAVTKSSGSVKSCAWVFGGSFPQLAKNGGVAETSKSWVCPFTMKGTLAQLITSLTTPVSATNPSQPIDRPLPGMTTSAYDALGGCLP
jgi:hypothetical protein